LIHVFLSPDKSVGRLKGIIVIEKSWRTEASGKLGGEGQASSPYNTNENLVGDKRSGNFNDLFFGLSGLVSCGKFPSTSTGVPPKISSPLQDFHIAIRGRKDSQTNSDTD
jgi:hypothetical protein